MSCVPLLAILLKEVSELQKHVIVYFVLITLLYSVSITGGFIRDANKILPRDIHCSGNETTLSDCDATKYDPMECTYLAKVICEGMRCPLTKVHNTDCLYVIKSQFLVIPMAVPSV